MNELKIDNTGQTQPISLICNTVTLRQGWQPSTTSQIVNEPTQETIPLILYGTSAEIIATAQQIERALDDAMRWHISDWGGEGMWLYARAEGDGTGEAQLRRALIYHVPKEKSRYGKDFPCRLVVERDGANLKTGVLHAQLQVWRGPWEGLSADIVNWGINLTTVGGWGSVDGVAYPNGGTADGRPWYTRLTNSLTPPIGDNDFYDIWLGIRRRNEWQSGSPLFNPVIEATVSETTGTMARHADVGLMGDVEATGSSALRISYATATNLVRRMTWIGQTMWPGIGPVEHIAGTYLVLARVKKSVGGDTHSLQMRYGYLDDEVRVIRKRTYTINNTAHWHFVELGEISVPPDGGKHFPFVLMHDRVKSVAIDLYCGRVTGGGTLDVDALVLIPTDHHLHIHGEKLRVTGGGTNKAVWTDESNALYSHSRNGGTPLVYTDELRAKNWAMPRDGGIAVVAAQRLTPTGVRSWLNDELTVVMWVYNRWGSYGE